MKLGVYGGSFVPATRGHLDIICRAAKQFDRLVVALAVNPDKVPKLPREVAIHILERLTQDLPNVEVVSLEKGFLADYAVERGASCLVRGLRNSADLEYEQRLSHFNKQLQPELETILIPAAREHVFVSSSEVWEHLKVRNWERPVADMVPPTSLIQLIAHQHRWAWGALEAAGASGSAHLFWEKAFTPYFGPGRYYHAWTHIADGLNDLKSSLSLLQEVAAAVLAWLFHDIVYNVFRSDNEERSADVMREICKEFGIPESLIERAAEMILATKNHRAEGNDARVVLSIDLLVLGKSAAPFDAYEAGVFNEYRARYSPKEILIGRGAWLVQFLGSHEQIYPHPAFEEKYGPAARANLKRSQENVRRKLDELCAAEAA